MNRLIAMITLALLSLSGIPSASVNESDITDKLRRLTAEIKTTYVPDSRLGVFDITYTVSGNNITLNGATTSAEAKTALMDSVGKSPYTVTDRIKLLPDPKELGEKTYGIVNLSVCNMRESPFFNAAMTTQALLGMPVRRLEENVWYRIQTPDRYISWVHPAAIHPVTREELHAWNHAGKVVVTAPYSQVYSLPDEESQPVSDVVAGNRLKYEGGKGLFYRVSYPDGRQGYLSMSSAIPEKKWRSSIKHDAHSILYTASRFMGIPYLWAGTSTKGVDCSGFITAVLFLHDVIAPRDADQQGDAGQRIEIATDFSNLQPGDLLLFGNKDSDKTKEDVVHIAFYLGDRKFIHSQGDVHISSFDPQDPSYDAFNLNRLLYASRILPFLNKRPELQGSDCQEFYMW